MELVKAERVLYGAAARGGIPREEVDGDLFLALRDALSRRLREGWEYAKWPELTRWEKRYFRKVWNSAVVPVTAGSEWYFAPEESYYVALRATSNAPADEDGTVSDDWAELVTEQHADDWDESLTYDAGDSVFYPLTETFYQCHTTTGATTGIVPTNAIYWGAVPDLDRTIQHAQVLADGTAATEIGHFFRLTRKNPKAVGRGEEAYSLTWWRSEDGIQVDDAVPYAWVEFRVRSPELDGELWSVSTAYTAGEFAYYDGDFYECVAAAAANESPESHAAKWELKEIPLFLERWLVGAVYADWLEMEGQKEKAIAEEGKALGELGKLVLVLEGQEGSGGGQGRSFVGVR